MTWRATGEERYIRIDKRHGLVDAGIKRGEDYRSATSLGFLGANGLPRENLAYYYDAAQHAGTRSNRAPAVARGR